MCCSSGNVSLPSLGELEEPLKSLLLYDGKESRRFINRIRKYNNCCLQTRTSFGVDNEVVMPGFSTTFTIQGQVYHRICSLLPTDDQPKLYRFISWGKEIPKLTAGVKIFKGLKGNF